MDPSAYDDDVSIESQFATTIKYIDLYVRQKTDLFLQSYVFTPFDFLAKKAMLLSVVVTLFAAGTVIAVAGFALFLATLVPLWAALLITGAIIFAIGGIIAKKMFAEKIILDTPTTVEMMNRGKA
jgi:hypothetical protein